MKVRFLPKNDIATDPVNRMRCFDVIEGLRANGLDVGLYQDAEDVDILVTLSLDFDRWLPIVRSLRAKGAKVVFDLSDNEFRRRAKLDRGKVLRTLPHLWNPKEILGRILYFRRRQRFDVKIDAFVAECDLVTCSSKGIYSDVEPLARARKWITDVIDTKLYAGRKVHEAIGSEARIVWTGMVSNAPFLDEPGPALHELQQQYGMEVRVITDPAVPRVQQMLAKSLQCQFTLVPWALGTVERELLECDVAIAPYSGPLSKSVNKVATYWALSLPVVASPLEEYLPVVRNGENGYIARSPGEWSEFLELLLNDPEVRQRQGDAGRGLVHEHYTPAAVCRTWQETLEALAASGLGHSPECEPQVGG